MEISTKELTEAICYANVNFVTKALEGFGFRRNALPAFYCSESKQLAVLALTTAAAYGAGVNMMKTLVGHIAHAVDIFGVLRYANNRFYFNEAEQYKALVPEELRNAILRDEPSDEAISLIEGLDARIPSRKGPMAALISYLIDGQEVTELSSRFNSPLLYRMLRSDFMGVRETFLVMASNLKPCAEEKIGATIIRGDILSSPSLIMPASAIYMAKPSDGEWGDDLLEAIKKTNEFAGSEYMAAEPADAEPTVK